MESNVQNDESANEMFKIADFGQNLRINVSSSKQKLANDQAKGKPNSKLPRIVRQPVQSKFYKSIEHMKSFHDQTGDSSPGSSRMGGFPMKMKKDDSTEKSKPSLIPRRKCNRDENCEVPKKTDTPNNQFIPECRNVQRVQMLINQEFCPEDRVPPPASVQSTRPIPTLGQIYGRINMIDSDRLNDWFMEFTPTNTTASMPVPESTPIEDDGGSSTVASPANYHQQEFGKTTTILDRKNILINEIQATNENVSVWLASDVEFPTDTESGYKTMSSKNAEKSAVLTVSECTTEKSNKTFTLGVLQDKSNSLCATTKPESECSNDESPTSYHQQEFGKTTVVLDTKNIVMNEIQTTNENVTVWLASDVEYPTRDKESGYKTMIPTVRDNIVEVDKELTWIEDGFVSVVL
ncbi:uncharacterized protein LOC126911964 [Spodoptera frugiperda]|uniref:Uncharacterized protein LOC126911964 n=1 Tax=Spodoptera frugiperda TaxID=7108 RepID=A0A9R0E224_SPOFR|nr:uncharacterized protein LOC126911964 [Spodoptera frugiperda]